MIKLIILFAIIVAVVQSPLSAQIHKSQKSFPQQNHISLKTGCGIPSGIFVDEINRTSATIHWSTNGVMQYKIIVVNMEKPNEIITLFTPLGSVALDNLSPCNSYRFIIIAKCPGGVFKSNPRIFNTLGCN